MSQIATDRIRAYNIRASGADIWDSLSDDKG